MKQEEEKTYGVTDAQMCQLQMLGHGLVGLKDLTEAGIEEGRYIASISCILDLIWTDYGRVVSQIRKTATVKKK
jgi:hypothetical protein